MLNCIHGIDPYKYWIMDDWFTPLTYEQMAEPVSHTWEASYDNDIEHGKLTSRDFANMRPELRTAFIKMRHSDTVKHFSEIADISSLQDDPECHGAGLHYSREDSYLQAHVDYELHPTLNKERRMNLILFMHHEWRKEWGGDLLLCDPWGKAVVEIEPKPGRLVAFECGAASVHGVRVIKGNHPRLSCAVYYLADIREGAWRRRAMFLPNRNSPNVPQEVQ